MVGARRRADPQPACGPGLLRCYCPPVIGSRSAPPPGGSRKPSRARHGLAVVVLAIGGAPLQSQAADATRPPMVLVPAAVWDGVADAPHSGWVVLVRGSRIEAAGPAAGV